MSTAIPVLTPLITLAIMTFGAISCFPQDSDVISDLAPLSLAIPESIEFNRDVRPILSDHCFYCHGPDPNHRQAELRLDDRQASLEHGAFVPGKGSESALIDRVESTDMDTVMPPPSANKPLSLRQKEILRRWIDHGAQYQEHWAYAPVQPPMVERPAGSSDANRIDANRIDFLVRKQLNAVGLGQSPTADRRTLIRRLYSDLIGLPPTPAEVDAFVNDDSPDAYSVLVERLLGDERYGERMAMHWLDVVRFADTIGYHSDNPRNIWPYRDYVIRSFNSNKPFDRFTIEQLAGDLVAEAIQERGNLDALVGSAFNRLLLTTEEGGAQPKDYESRMLADRVRAVGSIWLGQTTGCAQCHDHKFDPFTMRDFYGLGAFFADIQEGIIAPREEGMAVMTDSQRDRLEELERALAMAQRNVQSIAPELDAAQRKWEEEVSDSGFELLELATDVKPADTKPAEARATEAQVKAAKGVVAALKAEKRSPQQSQEIQKYFRDRPAGPYREELAALEVAETAKSDFYRSLPKCIVTKTGKTKRVVRILPRGNWLDESGEIVKPALPLYLPQLDVKDRELNRLDLAQWLVSKDNPLTARVTMNRLWKQFFGIGLSKVLDDLGAQGELPVNPELLDFLAFEFMDKGWDIKHMVRLMVMSQTYRQVSTATPALMLADPYNRQLARQTPFRIDAELVRDYALATSGLLVTRIGGPSAKPYQPDGYWENLNFPMRTYVHDEGDNQYRRGLYTWWQRTFLHPSMLAFDAPSREECCAERNRSNIPQQALVLLNDPTYIEAARALAVRALRETSGPGTIAGTDGSGPANDSQRVDWMMRQVLQRSPREEETVRLASLLHYHRSRYEREPSAANALLAVGLSTVPVELNPSEVASWTHVARVLLSLHETITRN